MQEYGHISKNFNTRCVQAFAQKPAQGGVGIKANDETKQAAKFAERMHAELYVNTL